MSIETTDPICREVAPGLAIQAAEDDGTGRKRYDLVHLRSGKTVFGCVSDRCTTHIEVAATALKKSDLDWDRPEEELVEVLPGFDLRALREELGLCFDPESGKAIRCDGDPI